MEEIDEHTFPAMYAKVNRYQVAVRFLQESNTLEGIEKEVTAADVLAFSRFMNGPRPTVLSLVDFVAHFEPGARLRDDGTIPSVFIGNFRPPSSGPAVVDTLRQLLANATPQNAFFTHVLYEELHPFTDCNGRSGRALWAYQMGWDGIRHGMFFRFYRQTLQNFQTAKKEN